LHRLRSVRRTIPQPTRLQAPSSGTPGRTRNVFSPSFGPSTKVNRTGIQMCTLLASTSVYQAGIRCVSEESSRATITATKCSPAPSMELAACTTLYVQTVPLHLELKTAVSTDRHRGQAGLAGQRTKLHARHRCSGNCALPTASQNG